MPKPIATIEKEATPIQKALWLTFNPAILLPSFILYNCSLTGPPAHQL